MRTEKEHGISCLFVGRAGGEHGGELIGALQGPQFVVEHHADVATARERAGQADFDLVVLDLRDAGIDVATIGADWAGTSAIAVTCGAAQRSSACEALNFGVDGVLCEPFGVAEAAAMLSAIGRMRRYRTEFVRFARQRQPLAPGEFLVGRSPVMRRLDGAIRRACEIDATVLVEGAAGTGKTFIAGLLHRAGRRANGPLVVVSAAGLAEDALVASVDEAEAGTLIIEEIERLPSAAQARLVRRLKERSNDRVASDARIVATSSGRLAELTSKGTFREDLYYRLNVFPVQLPLLRERLEDLPELALAFLRESSALSGVAQGGFTPAAMVLLETNPWPGNIAQLRNVVFRAHVIAGGFPVDRLHLLGPSIGVQAPPAADDLGSARAHPDSEVLRESDIVPFHEEEKRILNRALKACKGNVRRAAELLGIGRATLYRKIQVFELTLS